MLLGNAAWLCSLAILLGYAAWLCSLAILLGFAPWLCSLAMFLGYAPWLRSVASPCSLAMADLLPQSYLLGEKFRSLGKLAHAYHRNIFRVKMYSSPG